MYSYLPFGGQGVLKANLSSLAHPKWKHRVSLFPATLGPIQMLWAIKWELVINLFMSRFNRLRSVAGQSLQPASNKEVKQQSRKESNIISCNAMKKTKSHTQEKYVNNLSCAISLCDSRAIDNIVINR